MAVMLKQAQHINGYVGNKAITLSVLLPFFNGTGWLCIITSLENESPPPTNQTTINETLFSRV